MVIQNVKSEPGQDFDLLRKEGITYIQQFGNQTWTDHNEHDPGITILEQLCYAITDLSYRISYDVPDLLASQCDDVFSSPAVILTNSPVTLTDIKKLILDVPGVENVWIDTIVQSVAYKRNEKQLVFDQDQGEQLDISGLYRIWVNVMPDSTGSSVKQAVGQRLHANRSLCEDFYEVKIIDEQPIRIKATIEVGEVEDAELFLASLYMAIENHISPTITFYSLPQMLQRDWLLEDIMTGPVLDHGFIDDEELSRLERRKTIFTSDLVQVLHKVPGLRAIKNIQLISSGQAKDWKLDIMPDRAPALDIDFSAYDTGKDIVLQKNGLALTINIPRVEKLFLDLRKKQEKKQLRRELKDVIFPERKDRSIANYHSIQNHFPSVYALGEGELGDAGDTKRILQRNQLKAYLLFFDQILANYFSQVAHLKDIFSYEAIETYFSQVPLSVPEFSMLIENIPAYQDNLSVFTEDDEERKQRKNRLLNHLMARYAENFTHFSLILSGLKNNNNIDYDHYKVDFLKQYPEISSGRGKAINYTSSNESLGSLEKRIKIKLGQSVQDNNRIFFLVEHVLLKPIAADRYQQPALMYLEDKTDIFSLKVTYIFLDAFKEQQILIYTVLREETPAHVDFNLVWMSDEKFEDFATIYQGWRLEMAERTSQYKLRGQRNRIIDSITNALTYPLSDLPVSEKNKIVPYDHTGKVVIQDSEAGVAYQLFLITNNVEQKTTVAAIGTGEDLVIEVANLKLDSEFAIYAIKKSEKTELRTRLSTKVHFKIGIDTDLIVVLKETNAIPYNQSATIVIKDSQEKVNYKLFDSDNNPVSDPVIGVEGEINIVTYPLRENTTVVLRAAKTFEEADSEVVDITTMEIFVMPDADIKVDVDPLIVYAGTKGQIKITASQKSVQYQVYYKSFDENDIVYDTINPDDWHARYNTDESTSRDLYVRRPLDNSGFDSSAVIAGTGVDLILEIPPVAIDQLIFIKAIKQRKDSTDELLLKTKLILLVRPRVDLEWDAPASAANNSSANVTIKNPQRGIIYQLVAGVDHKPVSEAVVFHKNKSVEQARLGVDLVIDSYDDDVVALITPLLTVTVSCVISATQLYTGVNVFLEKLITITNDPVDAKK